MIRLGEYNTLVAVRRMEQGVYFMDRQRTAEVLLPNKFIPEGLRPDDELRLFVFKDSEDRLTATTDEPLIQLHEFALLQVNAVNDVGAFLNWGLDKDLLVPFREQPGRMRPGQWYLVYLYLDERTQRLAASGRYQKFLDREAPAFSPGEEVNLLIDQPTDLGVNVIVNHRYRGLLYHNEIFEVLQRGDHRKGYVKQMREDGKLDLSLRPAGYRHVEPDAARLLALLDRHAGYLPFTDDSDPDDIRRFFEMSKKTFKKALGALYKQRLVRLERDGIYRVGEE